MSDEDEIEPINYDQIVNELIDRWEKSVVNWYRYADEESDEYDEEKQKIFQDEGKFLEELINRVDHQCKQRSRWEIYRDHPSPISLIQSA